MCSRDFRKEVDVTYSRTEKGRQVRTDLPEKGQFEVKPEE